ncbi:MAG: hemolysin III family protein [Acidimicrobiia bacterium]
MVDHVHLVEASRRVKPKLRGWLHEIAFFVSIPAGITLIALSAGAAKHVGAIVFAVSLSGLYGTSALYHRGRWTPQRERFMRHLDHSMIYVLIAGSYTPLTLLALRPAWGVTLLCLAWTGAIIGITITVLRLEQWSRLGGILYIALGWLVVIALPQIVHSLDVREMTLLVAGGVLYTLGAVMFATKWPDPNPRVFGYHEIWHVFVVSAGACHYALVLSLVR